MSNVERLKTDADAPAENAGQLTSETQEALDALRLFGFIIVVILLPIASFVLWEESLIPLSLSLFAAFALIIYGSIMSIWSKNVGHIRICAKTLSILGYIWAVIFLIIAIGCLIAFIVTYRGDLGAQIEIRIYTNLVLETKPVGFLLGLIIFMIMALVSFFSRVFIKYFWVQPLSRKIETK